MDNQNNYSNQDNSVPTPEPTIFDDVVVDTEDYEKSMKKARNWLYVVAGLQFLMGIYECATTPDSTIGAMAFGIDAFISVCFLILALWSKKKPVPAFTIAIALYLFFVIGFMLLDPSNIYRGIIVKIFVTIALVKANKDARAYEAVKNSFGRVDEFR